MYDLRARYYNPALGSFLSQDTYAVNFSNPVELNRYVYTANDPVNGMDPSGQYTFTEYAITLTGAGAAGGALFGVGQTVFCGGNLIDNMLMGALGGAFFGFSFAYVPLETSAAGVILGGAGLISAINDIWANKLNKCNGFNATMSLLMMVLSGWGAIKSIDSIANFGSPRISDFGVGTEPTWENVGAGSTLSLREFYNEAVQNAGSRNTLIGRFIRGSSESYEKIAARLGFRHLNLEQALYKEFVRIFGEDMWWSLINEPFMRAAAYTRQTVYIPEDPAYVSSTGLLKEISLLRVLGYKTDGTTIIDGTLLWKMVPGK